MRLPRSCCCLRADAACARALRRALGHVDVDGRTTHARTHSRAHTHLLGAVLGTKAKAKVEGTKHHLEKRRPDRAHHLWGVLAALQEGTQRRVTKAAPPKSRPPEERECKRQPHLGSWRYLPRMLSSSFHPFGLSMEERARRLLPDREGKAISSGRSGIAGGREYGSFCGHDQPDPVPYWHQVWAPQPEPSCEGA